MAARTLPKWVPMAVPVLAALLYIATLRQGHDWGDDFAQYIVQARNIAEGKPLFETGYRYYPQHSIAPDGYPPLYSVLLSPIYALYGLDYTALKLPGILLLAWALWLSYVLLKPLLGQASATLLQLVVAASPTLWDLKDSVGNDTLVLVMLLLSLVGYRTIFYSRKTTALWWWLPVMFLLPMAKGSLLAIGPAMLLHGLVLRRPRYAALGCAALAMGALSTQLWLTPQYGYLQQLQDRATPALMLEAFYSQLFTQGFKWFWIWGAPNMAGKVLYVLTLPLAGLGLYHLLHKKRPEGWIFVAYMAVLAMWPWRQDMRLHLPVLPLYLLTIALACRQLAHRLPAIRWLAYSLPIATGVLYLYSYAHLPLVTLPQRVDGREEQVLWQKLKTLPQKAVIGCEKPRAVYLYSGHPCVVLPDTKDKHPNELEEELRQWQHHYHVQYVLCGPSPLSTVLTNILPQNGYRQVWQHGMYILWMR